MPHEVALITTIAAAFGLALLLGFVAVRLKTIQIARPLRPSIEIIARAHSNEEAELLRKEGVAHVLNGEHELALGMTRHVLEQIGEPW
jgi:K+:H+ antiporter